ncbi:hypothetical protein AeMF1_017077 [Aphanomyces euteiches]|nr:hypothetical protein AeMF1_017077 [Aphanomyces euteiches]KAH9193845.1 hypothetical protein AeNC1_004175 [Aphanomyces euteiches]
MLDVTPSILFSPLVAVSTLVVGAILFHCLFDTWGSLAQWKTRGNYPEPFLSWIKQYGGAIHLREVHVHAVLVTDPVATQHILVSNGTNYPRKPITMAYMRDKNLGESLSGVEGKQHDALRKWMNPLFTVSNIKSFIGIFNSQAQLYCQNALEPACDHKAPVDLSKMLDKLMLSIVGLTVLGIDFDVSPVALEAYEQSMLAISPLMLIGTFTIHGFLSFPIPGLMKRRNAQATFKRIVKQIIQDKLAAASSEAPKDLLDMMLPHSIIDEAVAHTVTFISGGYDTSSSSLSFVFGTLASHPKVVAAVRSEFNKVVSKHGSLSSWEAVAELTYTQAVIQETMRLNSTSRLDSAHSQGKDLFHVHATNTSKGTTIYMNMAAMHRNPKYWSKPEAFIPNRFVEGTPEWNADLALRGGKPHAFHYMPFSFGNKSCIGQRFAMVEMQVIVATLLSKYEFTPTSKTDMRQGFGGVTIRPANLEMTVRRAISPCA